jgi:acyl dehydratase
MSLDVAAVGLESAPSEFKYEWKNVVTYALGIGAKRAELDYLYEARGPRVYPMFGVVPGYDVLFELLSKTGADLSSVLHGAQLLRCHARMPPSGRALTVGRIQAVYDLKRLGQVVLATRTEVDGVLCIETEWSMLVRDGGGFGGSPPPRDRIRIPEGAAPSWIHEERVAPEQALLYRLSGDLNPLHADPRVAEAAGFPQGPILHGLCSYGFLGRAVIERACGGDGDRLHVLSAQFRKPIWPGEVLRTEGYDLDGGRVALRVRVAERDEAVITNAWAELKNS